MFRHIRDCSSPVKHPETSSVPLNPPITAALHIVPIDIAGNKYFQWALGF